MATPVIETVADTTWQTGTTIAATLPSGIVSGDLLLAFIGVDPLGGTGLTVTPPSGWTESYDVQDTGQFCTSAMWYRKADGAEGATIDITVSASRAGCARIYRISGAEDPATQAPEFVNVVNAGSTTTHDPATITPAGGSKDYLYFANCYFNTYTANVSTYPSGYTSTGTLRTGTTGAEGSLAYAVLSSTASSSENPGAYTLSVARDAVTTTVAIAPPATGASTLTASSGTYTYSGTAATLAAGKILTADSGSYAYTGTAAALTFAPASSFTLTADSGTYSYTGTNTGVIFGASLTADSGAYTYSGTAAALTFASAGNFTLTADNGAYSYSGTIAVLTADRVLVASSGAYAYSGTAATLSKGFSLAANSGAYAYSGTNIDFSKTSVLNAVSGNYVYNGTNVSLLYTPIGPDIPTADGLTVSGSFGNGVSFTASFGSGVAVKGKL